MGHGERGSDYRATGAEFVVVGWALPTNRPVSGIQGQGGFSYIWIREETIVVKPAPTDALYVNEQGLETRSRILIMGR